jgi:hypothetical protein
MWSWILRDSDLRINALARASSHCKRQTHPQVFNEKKNSGRESQGAWRQDELIGGKLPVVN